MEPWITPWTAAGIAGVIVTTLLGVAVWYVARLRATLRILREAARENDQLAAAVRFSADSIEILDAEGHIVYVNPAYEWNQHVTLENVRGRRPEEVENVVVQDGNYYEMLKASGEDGVVWSGLLKSYLDEGKLLEEIVTVSPIRDHLNRVTSYVIVKRDVTETRKLEAKLAQGQKLEAIGRLAAGISHEINTPMQFVGDNLRFLQSSFQGILPLLRYFTGPEGEVRATWAKLQDVVNKADLEFMVTELPVAIEQSLDGCDRVTHLVRAMKDFSHPGTEMSPVDLNRAITSTVAVATNEWKYVADVRLDLDPSLPAVMCNAGEVNQVVLNMVVNAAHAIAEAAEQGVAKGPGVISISTRRRKGGVVISIADNGIGIPVEIRAKVFDPFFTTKEVGKGTGQGLAIAHDVIVRRHKGSIDFESEPGRGTVFTVWLPNGGGSTETKSTLAA